MSKRILVAPLNWGLGHATRCIPIIQLLLKRGHTVSIASDGDSLTLLKKEFPVLNFFELPSYNIQYSRNIPAWLFTLWRTPKFLKSIRSEHRAIEQLIQNHNFDYIIADNRYGCWSNKVTSVFISHQLNLIMPKGMKWMGRIINFFHGRLIKKFNTLWVPDTERHSLSGELSNSKLAPEFIGVLSRFIKSENQEHKNKLAVVLSGPEPQRTLLEKNLLPQVIALNVPSVFIRGLVSEKMGESEIDQVKIINYLAGDELKRVIEQSGIIISRSGYSTIMDLAVLNKKAVLIPTPGQPEQEYFASRFMTNQIAYSIDQEILDLEDALELSAEYSGFDVKQSDELLLAALKKLGL